MNRGPALAPVRPRRWRRLALMSVLILALPVLAAWGTLECAVRWWPYPQARERRPPAATLVLDRCGRPLAALVSERGDWCLPCDDHGRWLPLAVVAVEDHRFPSHDGVDWYALAAAVWQDLRAGRTVRGASTLSMQVERLRAPRPRTVGAKLAELVRARQLERCLSKAEILTEWLERAPFGANLIGAGAASWRWFGLPCRDLTLAQAALLAGLPQHPARLRPDLHPAAARERRDHVLDRLLATGAIAEDAWRTARQEPLDARWHELPQAGEEAVLPACLAAAVGRCGTVATAFDGPLMRQAAARLGGDLAALASSGVDAAALVVVDNRTLALRAAVSCGGPGLLDLSACPRSSGSALKPFIYALAFTEQVCTPRTVLDDLPASWLGFSPRDYDRTWSGSLSAAEALAESRNLPAMNLLARLGAERTGRQLEAMGMHGLGAAARRSGLTLAVGGAEVTPRDLARAYALLAQAAAPGLSACACRQVLQCLAASERTAGVCPEAVRLRAAWKTGTSSGHRDAWCAALTPAWTVVAWFGTVRGSGSAALVGAEAAAPTALRLLAALDGEGGAWPESDPGSDLPAAKVLMPAPIAIVSPAPGTRIMADPDGPERQPRLELRCRGAGPRVWWFADGEALGCGAGDAALWWQAGVGRHRLRVVDAAGRSAQVEVTVEGVAAPRLE